ncbi:MAG TPA: hypothetical protein VHW74_07890 [Mycobacteriales bacterium]|nr:hypothetical protein [Mycobacteriales bacterium]
MKALCYASVASCCVLGFGLSTAASANVSNAKAPAVAAVAPAGDSSGSKVLRVGTYHGIKGQFATIQAAVDAARPGDWILVAPGDYKTSSSKAPADAPNIPSGVLITTPDLTIRGMNRNSVVVDGTKPGSSKCSSKPAAQNYGPKHVGLNGIVVYQANDVNVENLTTCNFLSGPGGDTGNEIWWDGLNSQNKIHGWGFLATYLSTTSTFYGGVSDAAAYGLFSSAWQGGLFAHDYGSNFDDAGFYIGACHQKCTQIIMDSQSEYNALGYSGSNSGGTMLIEHNLFDHNEDGFDTNSQNGDNPPPQDGSCPKGIAPPIKGAKTCWVLYKNTFADNNNPNVPKSGEAAQGPVGTGASFSGARNDTVMDNTFKNNGSWGTIVVPFPDSGGPCTGGTPNFVITGPGSCLYDEFGDNLVGNHYVNNGFFGNPTNGDFDQLNLESGEPTNCYSGNTDASGKLSSGSAMLQTTYPSCTGKDVPANLNALFLDEVLCNTQVALVAGVSIPCLPTDHYPRQTKVVMHPLPKNLESMPNPCADVPKNPWCPSK